MQINKLVGLSMDTGGEMVAALRLHQESMGVLFRVVAQPTLIRRSVINAVHCLSIRHSGNGRSKLGVTIYM